MNFGLIIGSICFPLYSFFFMYPVFYVGMVCPVCHCPGPPCLPIVPTHEVPEVFDVLLDEDCFRRMVSCINFFCFTGTLHIMDCILLVVEGLYETSCCCN